jgi:hypothetical protein
MRLLIELGSFRLELTNETEPDLEDELPFGFVPADLFETEIAVED